MKKTKKYLEEENKWLWYYHIDADEDAELIEIKQYDKSLKYFEETKPYT